MRSQGERILMVSILGYSNCDGPVKHEFCFYYVIIYHMMNNGYARYMYSLYRES